MAVLYPGVPSHVTEQLRVLGVPEKREERLAPVQLDSHLVQSLPTSCSYSTTMSGRPRHRISHPFHSVPPGRFHTSSSRTPSPSTSRSPPRGRVNSHLQSQIFDSISTTLGTPARPRIRQRRASNMPGFSSNLAPHRSGEQSDGREIVHKEYNLTNFEWSIYELQHLIKHVEECQPSIWALASEQEQPESLPEVLKRGVIIGDGWYKLEIGMFMTEYRSLTSSSIPTNWALTILDFGSDC